MIAPPAPVLSLWHNDTYFEQTLKPVLKKDAIVAIAFPGMKYKVHGNIPEEMRYFGMQKL